MKSIQLVQFGVVGLCTLLFGALLVLGLRNVWRAFRSNGWPTTDATVVNVERASTVHSNWPCWGWG